MPINIITGPARPPYLQKLIADEVFEVGLSGMHVRLYYVEGENLNEILERIIHLEGTISSSHYRV